MEWIDGNIGFKVIMKYLVVWMIGEYVKGEVFLVVFVGEDQYQDIGVKMLYLVLNMLSNIVFKLVVCGGGCIFYCGLVQVNKGVYGLWFSVKCDVLLVDMVSCSDIYFYVDICEDDVIMGYEVIVFKVSENQLFYLMSCGLIEDEVMVMVVCGFVELIVKELLMEYVLEFNWLIELQMEGVVG